VPRLLLLLAIILVAYILLQRARTLPPHKRKAEYLKLGMGIAVAVVIFLAVTGRMHWVGAALAGLLVALRQLAPLLIRVFPMLASSKLFGGGGPSPGQTSTVETAILRMQLDHDSGDLQGEVLEGSFKGWRLKDMNLEQLQELLAYCQREDADSARLLDSYLQQRFPGKGPFNGQGAATDSGGPMGRKEALAILGLEEGASEEDIVAAHRKLMQKLHPDRGGNDYLAAKVNQAKDLLLGR
jgi:hypothetical protein